MNDVFLLVLANHMSVHPMNDILDPDPTGMPPLCRVPTPLVPHSGKFDGKRASREININGDRRECDVSFYYTRSQWPLVSLSYHSALSSLVDCDR